MDRDMEIEKYLDEMENILAEGTRIPLFNKLIVDDNELHIIIEKLRGAVPLEIKRAHELLDEQNETLKKARAEADKIVEQAHAEGDRIVDLAKAEADRLVRQEEVVKAAEQKASEIVSDTQQYDRDMRAAADAYADKLHSESMKYAMEVFSYLEDNLTKTLNAIKENGDALRNSYDEDQRLEKGSEENR